MNVRTCQLWGAHTLAVASGTVPAAVDSPTGPSASGSNVADDNNADSLVS